MLTNRIGLIGIAAMVSVPFLLPWHTTPIPSFYAEWLAIAFGLLASLALIGRGLLPLPGFAQLALVLALIAGFHVATGRAVAPQIGTLYVLYLTWAAVLASTCRILAGQVGQEKMLRILAGAILLGALLASFTSLLQPWLKGVGWMGFPPSQGGPLGQANHLTAYLWLGIASGLYLTLSRALPLRVFWMAAVVILLTAAMAGQRSSFLYAAALIGIGFWQARTLSLQSDRTPMRLVLGVGLLFLLMQPLIMLLSGGDEPADKPPAAIRVMQQADTPSIRLQLWRVGLEGIAASPWLGNGVGRYSSLALEHAQSIPASENPGPAESAHNLVIDLGVEFGLPVALLVILSAAYWFRRQWIGTPSNESLWTVSTVSVLGLHGLIEYPFGYAYFLGLLAVLLGASGAGREFPLQRPVAIAMMLAVMMIGTTSLYETGRDYRRLESALILGKQPETLPQARAALLGIPSGSLLQPWINSTACVSLDPLQVDLESGLSVCRNALRFSPTIEAGVNQAVLVWRKGDVDAARQLLSQSRLATGYRPGGVDGHLEVLAARDGRLSVLFSP